MTPDYEKCIRISTQAVLREMLATGALVLFSLLVAGLGVGKKCWAGLRTGALVSSILSASPNQQQGWCMRQCEEGHLVGRLGRLQLQPLPELPGGGRDPAATTRRWTSRDPTCRAGLGSVAVPRAGRPYLQPAWAAPHSPPHSCRLPLRDRGREMQLVFLASAAEGWQCPRSAWLGARRQ